MLEFEKITATKRSLSLRRVICGVAVNDSWYMTTKSINGKTISCPVCEKWRSMIHRCYSEVSHKKHPTYKDATVCDEWLLFSNFEKWFNENNIEGYQLDKDVKVVGNKIYSPETCLFVPRSINNLLTDSEATRGKFPIGVSYKKEAGKFISMISIDNKAKFLGLYEDHSEAHAAYRNAKNKEIARKSAQYPELAEYLANHMYGIVIFET